jgi:hypothetical protein
MKSGKEAADEFLRVKEESQQRGVIPSRTCLKKKHL